MWYCSESSCNSYKPARKSTGSGEFRRKVRDSELLSASLEKLLSAIHFTGRVSVVVQNGRVLKSGYEEGYFRNHDRL
jgi:sulfur carrier protein ThiS